MNVIKERILGAVTVMSDADAEKVWKFVLAGRYLKNVRTVDEFRTTNIYICPLS